MDRRTMTAVTKITEQQALLSPRNRAMLSVTYKSPSSSFSVHCGIMSCMHIMIGYMLWWTFLSGSLPLSCYFIVHYYFLCILANKLSVSDLIHNEPSTAGQMRRYKNVCTVCIYMRSVGLLYCHVTVRQLSIASDTLLLKRLTLL